jgi:hypothetical protein
LTGGAIAPRFAAARNTIIAEVAKKRIGGRTLCKAATKSAIALGG